MSEPALPDTTGWSLDQIRAALNQLNGAYYAAQQEQASDAETRRQSIQAAVADLETLLGPADAAKSTDNIRGAKQFSGDEMVAGAAVTLPLIFTALEILTDTTLDLARAVGE